MKTDLYTKAVLTVIAIALVLNFASYSSRPALAQGQFHCKGKLKANVWGAIEPMIGGYDIEVDCSD
jgi:hypothetical protein